MGLVISLDQLLGFGVAALVLIAVPGPSVVFVIGRALAHGRSVALASVLGNALGLLVIVALVAAGLSVVLERSALAFSVLKLVGAAYLVWLGVHALRSRRALSIADVDADHREAAGLTLRVATRQGFVVGVTNPKAFLIIAAVLPQFVDARAGHVPVQMLALGLVAATIALLSDGLWAVAASGLRSWFARSPRRTEAVGTVGGISMIGLGITLALSGHRRPV